MSKFLFTHRGRTLFLLSLVLVSLCLKLFIPASFAANGINKQINFQGKVVNSNGTNVADGSYTFVFKLYTVSSSGTAIWTESKSITVNNGIFRTALGDTTPLPGNVDFNTDSLYLGINFNSDGEMTPRVQFTGVPYAFNADQVNGVTAASVSGQVTMKPILPGGLTLTSFGNGNGVTLTTSHGTSGNSGDISIQTGGTGGSGNSGNVSIDTGAAAGTAGTITIAGANATGLTLGRSGQGITLPGFASNNNSVLVTGAAGALTAITSTTAGQCFVSNAAGNTPSWGSCGSSGANFWQVNSGVLSPGNQTLDLAFGATATASAKIAWSLSGTNPAEKINGTTSFATLNVINNGVGDLFTASTGATTKFVITNGGNVGIGTAIPANLLQVSGSNATELVAASLINTSGTANQLTTFQFGASGTGVPTGALKSKLYSGGNDGDLSFWTRNTGVSLQQMVLTNSGFLGLGSTTPASVLDVRGIAGDNAVMRVVANNATSDLFTASSGASTRFVITNAGTVGIGTSIPASTLDVYGSAVDISARNSVATNFSTALLGGGSTYTGLIFRDNTVRHAGFKWDGSILSLQDASAGGLNPDSWTGIPLNSWDIVNNYFGIGTTTPTSEFYVTGTFGKGNALAIFNQTQTGANADIFTASVSGNTKFVIDHNGNVGIGTSIPTRAGLELNTIAGATFLAAGSGQHGVSLVGGGGDSTLGLNSYYSDAWRSLGQGYTSFIGQSAATGEMYFYLSNSSSGAGDTNMQSSLIERMRITKDGWLGLGTSSPVGVMQISGGPGTNGANAALIVSQTGASTNDILSASAGATTRFTVTNNGTIKGLNTSVYNCSGLGNNGKLTVDANGVVTCAADSGGGGAGGDNWWSLNTSTGVLTPGNLTTDLLVGGAATTSAKFAVLNVAGGTPTASISSGLSGTSMFMNAGGVLGTQNMASLQIGNATTGDINFFNGTNRLTSAGNLYLAGTTGLSLSGAGAGLNFTGSGTHSILASTGDITIAASTGTVTVGSGTGDITIAPVANNAIVDLTSTGDFLVSKNGIGWAAFTDYSRVGVGTTAPLALLDVRGSGGGNAAMILSQNGSYDIFTASAGATPRFTIKNDGTVQFNNTSLYNCSTLNGGGKLTMDTSGNVTCTADNSSIWSFDASKGIIYPGSQTVDFIFGGTSTASAAFRLHKNGTDSVASVSARTSYAGLVVDNTIGDLLTASSSGLTRFTVSQNGNVIIGNSANAGYKLDVIGSARIGNNTASSDDIFKNTSAAWTVSGYSVTSNDGVNVVTTTNNQLKLVTDLIGAGATLTAPAAGPAVGQNVDKGFAFQRPDKRFILVGNGTKQYDTVTDTFNGGPGLTAAAGAGVNGFQRPDGLFVVIIGNGTTTTNLYNPAPSGGTNTMGSFIAGSATSANVGAGSLVIRRADGKALLIHGGGVGTTSVYDPSAGTAASTLGTFIPGPAIAASATVTTGSFQFARPDGKFVVGLGGVTTTNIYDPANTAGGGSGGTFNAGPALNNATGAGAHVIQLPDGRMLVISGNGGTTTDIYDPIAQTFSNGPTTTTAVGAGGHSFQRADGKWIVVPGGNSLNLMLYDPSNGANGTFSNLTGANGLQGATGAGAGAFSFQRPDGKYVIVHGAGNGGSATGLTTVYDAGWNTSGTWISEDITNTKISTYSAMIWSANPQSANNNARLDGDTLSFSVKTGDSPTSLANNPWISLQDSGDLIKAYGNAQYAKIKVDFAVPVRSYPQSSTFSIFQRNIWAGEGEVFYRRSLIQPAVFSVRVQNPLVQYGDPTVNADPAFGRNFATASATFEGVNTDNSNRLTLTVNRNSPTASGSGGIIFASASANLGATAAAGTHTIERSNGQFLIIIGGTSTTRVYDPDTNTFSAGPTLPFTAGVGAHSFLMPDGRFFVVLGNTTNNTAIFDGQANVFMPGPKLYGNVGTGANTFQRPDGLFIIVNGGATGSTNILDPLTMTVSQGPFTTAAVGAGALNIKRFDGRILVMHGNNVGTSSIYDPVLNAFVTGPALTTGGLNNGSTAVQMPNGRFWIKTLTTLSQVYDPVAGTFAVGPTGNGTILAGAISFPRPDGKFVYMANATSTIIDNAVTGAGVAGPTIPCTLAAGSNIFQRPTGEYVVLCGNSANTFIVDAGWNLGGTYTSEQINVPNLSSSTGMYWRNVGQGDINVKYKTASSRQALGLASWKDLPMNGSLLNPAAGDTWFQARIDLQGVLQDLPGAKTRVWLSESNGGMVQYYRQVQAPILSYWRLMNATDPSILTLTNAGSNIFRFTADGQAFTSDEGAWNSGGADLAERYTSTQTLEAGEVVVNDPHNPQGVMRSNRAYEGNILGVVSTKPGFVAGAYTADSYPIGLVGRVPVKVSTENGSIKTGDYLTAGSIPGYAMKATYGGRVLGKALEDFNTSSQVDCPKIGSGNLPATQCGTILMFVNLTNYEGQPISIAMQQDGKEINMQGLLTIQNEGKTLKILDTEGLSDDYGREQQILAYLSEQKDASAAASSEVTTGHVNAVHDVISPLIVTDLLLAKHIKADSIEGLDIISQNFSNSIASSSSTLEAAMNTKINDMQMKLSDLTTSFNKIKNLDVLSTTSLASSSGDVVLIKDSLLVLGAATLNEADIADHLTIGNTLTFTSNTINTIGVPLEIQPMRQGDITLMGGALVIRTNGELTVGENATFEKDVAVKGVLSATAIQGLNNNLSVSGSATFDKIQFANPDIKIISNTEVSASASAGIVTLKANQNHIKINNDKVGSNSLLFITPKTNTKGKQLFIKEQKNGEYFTVGIDEVATFDIDFNFLIVN